MTSARMSTVFANRATAFPAIVMSAESEIHVR